MAGIKALIVGVSDYSAVGADNLPFCINDIQEVSNALITGLNVDSSNIITCGDTKGKVSVDDFLISLQKTVSIIEKDDTFIFYFSGHGGNSSVQHRLLLSNGYANTQNVIDELSSVQAQNKIIILDSCMSGNFSITHTSDFPKSMSLEDFVSKGYVVFSSCSDKQYSYGHPQKPMSLFTSFLCEAIKDKTIIRKGEKSLDDIRRLLFLYLDIWNKNNPAYQQNPIFRSDLGGTIFFSVQNYVPYQIKSFYEESDKYIIYSVDPIHNGIAKRYVVKIILKEPFTFYEISQINHEIVDKLKFLDIYKTQRSEYRWKGKATNIIFCYFGRDEEDLLDGNYICHTTWVDKTQDKAHWYRIYDNCEMINDIHFKFHPYYNSFKLFNRKNTGTKEELYVEQMRIVKGLVTLAEKVISLYNEFTNKTITETELVQEMEPIIPDIDKLYFAENNLKLAPKELKEWSQCCSCLFATIHDFTLFYNSSYLNQRSPQNRKECMDMTITRYYENLEKLKEIQKRLSIEEDIL